MRKATITKTALLLAATAAIMAAPAHATAAAHGRAADSRDKAVIEAADAVASLAADNATADKISAAAQADPAMAAYADALRTKTLDKGHALKTAAAEALARYAKDCSPKAEARALYALANVYATMFNRQSIPAIEKAIAAARRDRSPGSDARLTLYELTRLYLLYNLADGEDPMRYPELFSLEKRALECYENRPDSRDKAEAYQILAVMKNYTSFPDDFNHAQETILLADPATDRSRYEYSDQTGLTTNSNYYYTQSLAIFRRVLGREHPDALVPWINYLMSRAGKDGGSSIVASADSAVAAAEKCFTMGQTNPDEIKIMRDYIAAACGYPLRFSWKYDGILATLRGFYGEENPNYLITLTTMANALSLAAAQSGLQQDFYNVEKEYERVAAKAYVGHPGQFVIDETTFLYAYERHDPTAFKAKLDYLAGIVMNPQNKPSWKLVAAGRQISYTYYRYGMNEKAAEVARQDIRNVDLLAGGGMPPVKATVQYDLMTSLQNTGASQEEIKRQYAKTINTYAETGLSTSIPVMNYCRYLNGINDLEEVKTQLKALLRLDDISQNPLDRAYVQLSLGQTMLNTGKFDTDSLRAICSQAAPVYMAGTQAMNHETVLGYVYLANIYSYIDKELFIKTLEKGWETAQEVCLIDDASRQDIFNALFTAYLNTGRDKDAERINEQQIATFDTPELQNSYSYIEFLWNRYTIAVWRTPNDPIKTMPVLMDIYPIIKKIYDVGQSQDVIYNSGSMFLTASLDMIIKSKIWLDNYMDSYKMTYETAGKFKEYIDYANNIISAADKQFVPVMANLVNGFPTYAASYEYRLMPTYVNLIQTLFQWHAYVKHDREQSLHYMKLIAEVNELQHTPWLTDNTMAEYYIKEKDYDDAYTYLRRCKSQMEHFSVFNQIALEANMAHAASQINLDDEAVEASLAHSKRIRSYVLGSFDYMASNEREQFLNTYGNTGVWINSLLNRRPDRLSGPAYDAALFDKGLLLHSWERLKRSIMRSGDKEIIAKLDTLDFLKKQLSATEGNVKDFNYGLKYGEMQTAIDRLEKELAWRTAKFRSDTMRVATWQEVQARLGDGEAAIEFIQTDSVLAALVLRKGYETPRYVRLGNAMDCYKILDAVADMPAQTKARRLYTYGRSRLYEMIWQPMEECLQGVKTVYYSPTAFLHRVAFAAIPVDKDTRLIDRYDLRYLSTTAQLLRGRHTLKARSAAVFGGMYYSPEHAYLAEGGQSAEYRAAMEETFPYLGETRAEAETISDDMKDGGIDIKRYVAENATEPNFYALDGQSTDIIHLATHGFYIDEKDVAANAFLANHPGDRYSSMQRTGLTFDGANATWLGQKKPDREDGILTAAELSTLDLGRAQLVTLSACETALGDYSTEGVYGLQRGFKEAGARTLILSLWNVSDRATSLFMQDFYSRWLAGMSKHDAFTQAVTNLRTTHPDPFFWAAFVMLDPE